jgi:hypothetical protein
MSRKEKNNHELSDYDNTGRKRILEDDEKQNDYADENYNVTDTDAAEIDPRIRQASQATDNTIEEGDEDYDDEEENTK